MTYEMLSIEDLKISFGESEILHGINLTLPKGKLIGLIGPNGCGKSTIMRCISKINKGWTGKIRIDGEDISQMRPLDIAHRVSSVPAELGPTFGMTVMEMVMLGRYPFVDRMWWESKNDEKKVREALRTFGLEQLSRRQVSHLSSGERKRALIAKAYVQETKIMLVDEPTSHLDMKYKLNVMEYLKKMSLGDMTVLVAEHDISLMARYCDLCIIMKEGRIVDYGDPKKIITEELVREVYDVQSKIGIDEDGELFILPKVAFGD